MKSDKQPISEMKTTQIDNDEGSFLNPNDEETKNELPEGISILGEVEAYKIATKNGWKKDEMRFSCPFSDCPKMFSA